MDAKFQAILPHAEPGADGEGAAAAMGGLALSRQRRPQRQNAFVHFKKVPLLRTCVARHLRWRCAYCFPCSPADNQQGLLKRLRWVAMKKPGTGI